MALLMACVGSVSSAFAFESTIVVNPTPGAPVNKRLLGNNTQWVDNGDHLTDGEGKLNGKVVKLFEPRGIPVLRYPGGTLSDSYHWKDGVGALQARPAGRDLSNRKKSLVFGTDEFLQFAKRVGAIPVLTVNVPTGTAAEAAEWVAYTNESAATRGTPKVPYWEIGNEPYLKEAARPDLALTPTVFIQRFNEFATAMRRVDPSIKVGLPLRTDRINGIPVSAYPDFNKTLLSGLQVPVDFVALHYYFPFAGNKSQSDSELFWATMAAPEVMREDLIRTRKEVRQHLHADVPLAVTEYNAMFTLGNSPSSGYITTLAAALLTADMLRVFTEVPDVEFADYWSLAGNWHFGTVDQAGQPRAGYHVLDFYAQLLQGNHVAVKVTAPTFTAPNVGLVPGASALPLVTAVATTDGKVTRLLVINKALKEAAQLQLTLPSMPVEGKMATIKLLTGASALAGGPGQSPVEIKQFRQPLTKPPQAFSLPPHSLALVEIQG